MLKSICLYFHIFKSYELILSRGEKQNDMGSSQHDWNSSICD